MRDIWYGDRRDRVKWGALVHLARTQQLSKIIQVALYRTWKKRGLKVDGSRVPVPKEVWDHFSCLGNIQRLAEATGIEIVIFGQEWQDRQQYVSGIIQDLRQHHNSPKVVFLDPDTGIAPKVPKLEHVTMQDIQRIWEALEPDDWLAVYQHAYRSEDWLEVSKRKFGRACGVEEVRTFQAPGIAKDVAVTMLQ